MSRIALRLASLRDHLAADPQSTLARVAESGFEAVEVTQLWGDSNEQFAELLKEHGLQPVSMHVHLHDLRARFTEIVKTKDWLPISYLVIPIVQLDEYGSGWERVGADVGHLATLVRDAGLTLAYQPNRAEFRPDRGRTGMDFFEEATTDELVYELDLKILSDAGADVADTVRRLGGRAPLIVLDFDDREPSLQDPVFSMWRHAAEKSQQLDDHWLIVNEKPGSGDRFAKLAAIHNLLTTQEAVA